MKCYMLNSGSPVYMLIHIMMIIVFDVFLEHSMDSRNTFRIFLCYFWRNKKDFLEMFFYSYLLSCPKTCIHFPSCVDLWLKKWVVNCWLLTLFRNFLWKWWLNDFYQVDVLWQTFMKLRGHLHVVGVLLGVPHV